MPTDILIENDRGLSRRPLFNPQAPHSYAVYVAKLVTPARRYLVEASLGSQAVLEQEPEVRAYNRAYEYLGRVLEPTWDDLASLPQVIDTWDLWTGGDGLPGDAVWFEDRPQEMVGKFAFP